MTALFSKHLWSHELPFFALAMAIWCGVLVFGSSTSTPAQAFLLFALIASISTFLILKFLGYFDPLRLYPRKSDLILVMFAMPLGGSAAELVFLLLFKGSITNYTTLLAWTPLLALVIFGGHHLLVTMLLRGNGKMKVVLDLLPRERATLLADLSAIGILRYFEFLSRGDLEKALDHGSGRSIAMLIISRGTAGKFSEDKTLLRAHLAGIPITDFYKIVSTLSGRALLSQTDLWGFVLSATPQTPLLRLYAKLKLTFEPIIALALLILLAPVMVFVALLIKLTSSGPVFYSQIRTGYLDRTFVLYKFRSMHLGAEADGPRWSNFNDDRVTTFGAFLRKTRLDELPQLWNVLRGEMAFFGPRPERPEIAEQLKLEIPLFSLRTAIRPGVTGWAQVCAGYVSTVEGSRRKLEYDLYYIQHMSPRLDLVILAMTLKVAICGAENERAQVSSKEFNRPLLRMVGK